MHAPSRITTITGLIVALAMTTLGACGQPAALPSASPVAMTTAVPSATAEPASATPSVTSVVPTAAVDPIPEGDYTTGPITAEMMVSAAVAHGLDAGDTRGFIKNEGFKIHEAVTMRLKDGALKLLVSLDGGKPTVAWEGAYAFSDDGTMIAGSEGYPITYGIRWDGESLHIGIIEDAYPDPFDLVAQVALYESAPFTAVP